MAAPRSVNLVAQQTVHSDFSDYVDRNDIIQLLNVDLAPYMSNGVVYRRYRIEVSSDLNAFEVPDCDTNHCERARLRLTRSRLCRQDSIECGRHGR